LQISKHELQLKKWKFKLGKPISLEGSLSDIAVENRRIAFDISVLPEQAILQVCRSLLNSFLTI
jgi:hypothetical protein